MSAPHSTVSPGASVAVGQVTPVSIGSVTVTDDSGATATSVAVSITAYVDDDGDGIAEDDRERLFERFTRLDDSRVRNISGGGFGLGLAIARQVVVAHGGTLTSHSRADGSHGAEFRVRLPIS